MKKNIILLLIFIIALFNSCSKTSINSTYISKEEVSKNDSIQKKLKKIDFILDWTPNTNHTGLFVAKEKGYFEEIGIDFDIKIPPEDSTSDLIINNKAQFGIYFQDLMAFKLAKGAPITAVAAIIEHNTSGILSNKSANVHSPKDLVFKKYGTWNDPVELAMIKSLMEKENTDFSKLTLVPNVDSSVASSFENNLFNTAWVYYAYDKVMCENLGIDTNFFYLKDYLDVLDYYSPIIIANNDYLKKNKDEAKKIINAIKKGYIYAIENPKESAEILIKYNKELEKNQDFIIKSQKYISNEYSSDKEKWGQFDKDRWNNFYKFINENNIIDEKVPLDTGFTNWFLN